MKVQSKNKELYLRLHRTLREFPRYNRFLVKASEELSLALAESHVLVETSSGRDSPGINDFSRLFDFDKSVVSRLISKMEKKRLVEVRKKDSDHREKEVLITQFGKEVLEKFDEAANERLRAFEREAGLSNKETKELVGVMQRLADALRAGPSNSRQADHPLRPPIRRLTRAFGLLGRRTHGRELNALEWQLLLTVCEHSGRYSPGELGGFLQVDKVSLSVALGSLSEQGLLKFRRKSGDERSKLVAAGSKAFAFVRQAEEEAAARYSEMESLSETEVKIVEKWMRGAAIDFYLNQSGLRIKKIEDKEEILPARRLILDNLVSNIASVGPSAQIEGSICHEDNLCLALLDGKELLACLELGAAKGKEKGMRLINLASKRRNLHPDAIRAFVLRACLSEGIPVSSLSYSPSALKLLRGASADKIANTTSMLGKCFQ